MGRVVPAEEMEEIARRERDTGRRLVFTNGCFDILHRGHVEYLARARRLGDLLVVGLNGDDSVRRLKGKGRPLNPLEDRAAVLAALAAVDYVVPFDEDTPQALVERLSPRVLVKGGDYRPEEVAGGDWVRAHGGEVVIIEYLPGRSTSALLARRDDPDISL